MQVNAPSLRSIVVFLLGITSGVIFAYIVGYLDTADYLVELWTLWIVEIPFVLLWAVYDRKYGWRICVKYILISSVFAYAVFLPLQSLTVIVYLKVALMGLILGEYTWFDGSFMKRLAAVSFPGLVIAFVFGLPLVLKGVSPEVIDRFRNEALEMYKVFMTSDEAVNSANNAVQMFQGIFRAGFAVFVISSFLYSWMAFQGSRFVLRKFAEEPEVITSFHLCRLPFHAVWIFLVSFGALLTEYQLFFPVALNVFVVMTFLYFVQGLAIVIFHMNRLSLGRLPRILFWLICFITIIFSGIFLVFTGLIDNWFNLRPSISDNVLDENDEVY